MALGSQPSGLSSSPCRKALAGVTAGLMSSLLVVVLALLQEEVTWPQEEGRGFVARLALCVLWGFC